MGRRGEWRRVVPVALVAWVAVLLGPVGTASGAGRASDASVAATVAGTVVGWGDDRFGGLRYGQLDIPAGLDDVVAVSAGTYHALALRADGTVVAWGSDVYGRASVPDGLTGVVQIATADYHSLALRADGTVVEWGDDPYYEGGVPDGLTGVTAIAAGGLTNLALRADGTLVEWGYRQSGPGWSAMPTGLTGVTAIAAGGSHRLAVTGDGTVRAWGWNLYEQTDVPAGLRDVVAVSGGAFSSQALRADGTVVGWGGLPSGERVPEDLAGVVALAGRGDHVLALEDDGTVRTWAEAWSPPPAPPAGLRGVSAIAANFDYSLAVVGASVRAPGPPSGLTAVAGPGAATVTWRPPADGGPVSSYRITATPISGGEPVVVLAPAAATSARLLGLTAAVDYAVTVVAVNAGGASTAPDPVTVTPTGAMTPYRISGVPETSQFVTTVTEFESALTGTVLDRDANPVPDVPVTLTVEAGSAAFPDTATSVVVTTDPDGVYTAPQLVAGLDPGPVVVTATVGTGTGSATHTALVRPRRAGTADLRVALSSVGTATVGTVIPITIRVKNTGSTAATEATAVLVLPRGLTVTQSAGGPVTPTATGSLVTLTLPGLDAGADAAAIVNVRVTATALTPARLRAVVGSATPESVYRNNTAVTVPLQLMR